MKRIFSLVVVLVFLSSFAASGEENPARSCSALKDDYHPGIHRKDVSSEELRIFIIDVGQGDAIFLEFQYGETMLIDAGSHDEYGIPHLKKFLANYFAANEFKQNVIDFVIATHPDSDHISGLKEVIELYDVGWYIDNGQPGSGKKDSYPELMKEVNEEDGDGSIDYIAITERNESFKERGYFKLDDIANFKECNCFILGSYRKKGKRYKNDASVVMKVECGSSSALFMGDAEMKEASSEEKFIRGRKATRYEENRVYKRLLKMDALDMLSADLLKAGHHGANTSSAEIFLGKVMPKVSIVSCGDHQNSSLTAKYGHPRAAHIARLENHTTDSSDEGQVIDAFLPDKRIVSIELNKRVFLTATEHELEGNCNPEDSDDQCIEEYGDVFLIIREGHIEKVDRNDPEYQSYFQ